MTEAIRLRVNGVDTEVVAAPGAPLLAVLREGPGLVGSRFGCGLGQCGACFVRLDGAVVPACDTPVEAAAGRSVVTVEGLAPDGELHPVQQALLDAQAAQCGFCISGIAVRAAALLETDPAPDAATVARALDGNLCRCGAQRRIIDAVVAAGRASAGGAAR